MYFAACRGHVAFRSAYRYMVRQGDCPGSRKFSGSGIVSELAAEQEVKRPRGRPKGSQNRVSRDAKELLAAGAPKAIHRLLKIASGGPIFTAPGPERKRERQEVDIDQQLSAIGLVLSRLLPALRAAEITATSDVTVVTGEVSTKDLAGALLGVLHRALPQRDEEPAARSDEGGIPPPPAQPVAGDVISPPSEPEPTPDTRQLAEMVLSAVTEAAKPRARYEPPPLDEGTKRLAQQHERELAEENVVALRLIRRREHGH